MIRRDALLPFTRLTTIAAMAVAIAGCHRSTPEERAAAPIVQKNAEARGGLDAWRAVKTMTLSGQLEAGRPRDPVKQAMDYLRPRTRSKVEARRALRSGAPEVKPVLLPFVMDVARPHKTRLEVRFQGEDAIQVFDGTHGWKVRPFLGRREVEPYTDEEMRVASLETDLDGPLIDHAAKGSRVELVGTEKVEGRDAHKLKVTLKSGQVRHVWVDAETFLDVKIDGTRRMDGKPRTVWTTFRDYRPEGGILVPHVLETTADGVPASEKILVEHVTLNPPLAAARFAKPE